MATGQMSVVIQHLRRAMLLQDEAGLTDGQLLEDYISRRAEAAFAALVQRHGPMVWSVCRRVLTNYHDAEDAFQATFLVLVRRAASIASPELLANWLYGVAHQTAMKSRATLARRKARERQVAEMPQPAVLEQDLYNDPEPLLDQELSCLPDIYRVVIVLCDLEGKTRKEAARHLGLPEGTIGSRLARARMLLAKRLVKRGVTLSGAALAAVLSRNVAPAGVPDAVVSSTIRAASFYAAGKVAAAGPVSVKVATLTEGVLKSMLLSRLKIVVAVVLALGVITLGGGLSYRIHATEEAAVSGPAALATPAPREGKAGRSRDDETLKHTLLTLEKARWDAGVRQDADALDKLLTRNWVGFSKNDRYTRADYLGSLKRQRVAPDHKIHDVELIRLNEKAAILSYQIEYKLLTSDGELLAKRHRRAFVSWVQRGGGWVVACIQDIVIGPE
jgi:RNA polymerase sigma factor (sigma-70 family)